MLSKWATPQNFEAIVLVANKNPMPTHAHLLITPGVLVLRLTLTTAANTSSATRKGRRACSNNNNEPRGMAEFWPVIAAEKLHRAISRGAISRA
jgi:hypothetical protein